METHQRRGVGGGVWRDVVETVVDVDRCDSPRECRVCLEACPESLFILRPPARREPTIWAEDWAIAPALWSLCRECTVCVDACPSSPISLSAA